MLKSVFVRLPGGLYLLVNFIDYTLCTLKGNNSDCLDLKQIETYPKLVNLKIID